MSQNRSNNIFCCCSSKKNHAEHREMVGQRDYKFTYFDLRGRGELTRLIFAQAGVDYEDIRIERSDWPQLKSTTPWGTLPVLETEGYKIGQSMTIARYVAEQHGLAGKNIVQRALANSAVDAITDIFAGFIKYMKTSNEQEKIEYMQKFTQEQLPPMLGNLERFLVANDGGDGYLIGKELTWADLYAFHLCDTMTSRLGMDEALAAFPKLQAHHKRIAALPKIAAWLVKRPENSF